MKVINNTTNENNHYRVLIDLISKSNKLCIVSPFISSNINLIDQTLFKELNSLIFVTTFPNVAEEQEKKISYFLHLISISKKYSFELEILIDDSLHGKIYLGKSDKGGLAVITSANYTNSGLKVNNEWGVILDDSETVYQIWENVINGSRVKRMSEKEILIFAEFIKANKIHHPPKKQSYYDLPKNDLTADGFINNNQTCWLKPLGSLKDQVKDSELHNLPIKDITFPKRPIGIKKGDIVICYASRRKIILGVYKVISDYYQNDNGTKYKYSIDCENLYPYYGAHWFESGIRLATIKSDIIENGSFTITPTGDNNYAGVRRQSKMEVTNEYAGYVMSKIAVINSEYALTEIND